MKLRGFTLVEVMVAVLILALLSATAALSFSRPLAAARFSDAGQAVVSFDQAARQAAVVTGKPVRIVLDLADNSLIRLAGRDYSRSAARIHLPSGVRLAEVRVGGQSATESDAKIDVSPLGMSRTYAVRIAAADREQWILIAGLTGDATVMGDKRQLDAINQESKPGPPGRNAD